MVEPRQAGPFNTYHHRTLLDQYVMAAPTTDASKFLIFDPWLGTMATCSRDTLSDYVQITKRGWRGDT